LIAERQGQWEDKLDADFSNSGATDCCRSDSCVLCRTGLFAQAHIRGTLTHVKDGTIGVQNAKGETISINLPATPLAIIPRSH
jgi:hypothetical protein